MKAKVYVVLKPGLLDAQGKTIKSALESLGFHGVKDVRLGKYVELELERSSITAAAKDVERMCQKLLANPVIETYRYELAKHGAAGSRQQAAGQIQHSKSKTRNASR